MGLFEKDYLLRLLEQLTDMLAAIRESIRGGRPDEAIAAIVAAQRLLGGPLAGSLDRLDAGTVASLLGMEKARMHAVLLRLEAEAREAAGAGGEEAKVRALRERAAAVERSAG
jgi:hypothetical protein